MSDDLDRDEQAFLATLAGARAKARTAMQIADEGLPGSALLDNGATEDGAAYDGAARTAARLVKRGLLDAEDEGKLTAETGLALNAKGRAALKAAA